MNHVGGCTLRRKIFTRAEENCLTSPYPQTTTCFPPNITSVVLFRLQGEWTQHGEIMTPWRFHCKVFAFAFSTRHHLIMARLPIQDGLPATVEVVEFLLGDWVIHIHGRNTQFSCLGQLVEPGNTLTLTAILPFWHLHVHLHCNCYTSWLHRHKMELISHILPVDPGDTLLHNALGLLKHIWVFFINPVGKIPTIIQDLE